MQGEMDHWDHRVIRSKGMDGSEMYQIHEVYYATDGTIWGYIEQPSAPCGDSLEDLSAELGTMMRALIKPVLDKYEVDTHIESDEVQDWLAGIWNPDNFRTVTIEELREKLGTTEEE